MLRPPSYKLLLCILCLGRDLYDSLAKELDHTLFEGLLAGVPCPDGDKALHERLQLSGFRAPYIGRLSFDLVHRIVGAQSPIGKCAMSDTNGVKEGGRGRRRKGRLAYCRSDLRFIG